ncbi:Cys-Gln thioester bond-forming surface protein [Streptomyces albireticuli]|uniref:Peptidase n=1 Tax=Streptomyces albireticuli TaxID=1940 RepID=A0A2A2D3T4_9ACTN|nr:Cys-Gln thioester bond-forming surface protein [Streptomyces albireticuli]MCD9141673.1 Cys-Gln thioester bond-forming surface protein [Streptomyces albireticuli]MCD9164076.1 Cys-Gln thioester bond-forming surface protein [Streptomyces albireticuli]MCD9189847.1 Cys-Gln thioester bond-forming surface protein [Streptomyces albireticuli]PAU46194.1 peptidase [Streptomyces albireticuli]
MISVMRRRAVRCAAAALVSGLASVGTIAAGGPAAADDAPQNSGGVTATLGRITAGSAAVVHDRRKTGEMTAGLFEMKVDGGGSLQTYCVDILTNTVDGARYKEVGWGESSLHANKNAGKIRWILQHSYPQVNDLAALAKEADTGALDADTAAAGTQVAIWRYSDGVAVDAKDPAAEKLADYLYKNARDTDEPEASLKLTPSAVSGRSGQKLGPVTVHTNASNVTVTPSGDAAAKGVRIVDKDGKPVTSTGDGGELFFDVRPGVRDGSLALRAMAATKVPVGRVFIGDHTTTQTQILAGSSQSTVSASATATWATKGAIPALSARKNCAKGGVEVTADNQGDAPYTFELDGAKHTVPAGRTETIFVKVAEDQAYKFTIRGPHGLARTFSGILDCATAETGAAATADGGAGAGTKATLASRMSPASTGGTGGTGKGTVNASVDGDLAVTGGGNANPTFTGIAIALIVVGSGAVYLLRREKAASGE